MCKSRRRGRRGLGTALNHVLDSYSRNAVKEGTNDLLFNSLFNVENPIPFFAMIRNRSCYFCFQRKKAVKEDAAEDRKAQYTNADLIARRQVPPAPALRGLYDFIVTDDPRSVAAMKRNPRLEIETKVWEMVEWNGTQTSWFNREDEKYEREKCIQPLITKFNIPMTWAKFRAVTTIVPGVGRLLTDEVSSSY